MSLRVLLHRCTLIFVLAISSAAAAAQQTFDAASIYPSQKRVEFERDGATEAAFGRLRMRDVTVSTCIKLAYRVQQSQILGPEGMDQQHYDITAKTDPSTSLEQMSPMLQNLLAERFHLAFHREKRELAVYAMVVDKKGLKMKPSTAPDGELYRQNSATGMVAKNITMQELADYISGPLGAPLVDQTHLPGKFDLTMNFTPYVDEDKEHQASPTAILNAAFRGELGLQLVRTKAVVDVLVIDHIEAQTAN